MLITDILLIAALAVFVVAWWVRATPRRPQVLLAATLVAAAAGVWGILIDRWQDGFGLLAALAALAVLGVNRWRRTDRTDGVPWLSGLGFAGLAALAAAVILTFPITPLPKPSGPHPVGVRSFELDDASRPGVFSARPGEPRRLLVRVWYPAGDVKGLKRRPYYSSAEAHSTAESVGKMFGFPPFTTHQRHVATNSYEDAPLLPDSQALPVIFYSHGYTSHLGQNTVLMEHLASHGYVVFSVQHTYDSTTTAFPDGTLAPADPALREPAPQTEEEKNAPAPQNQALAGATLDQRLEGWIAQREKAQRTQVRLLQSGDIWVADRRFVHDRLQAGDVPAPIRAIAAASDLARVGEMGMSFGGAISGSLCVVDPRCAAGINLDGGDFPFQAFATPLKAPFLMFHSDLAVLYRGLGEKAAPQPRSFNEFSYEAFDSPPAQPVYRVMLKDTAHVGISDNSLFIRRPARDPILGSAPARVMIGAQNDFVLGFFDRHLRGRANAFPAPQLEAYEGHVVALPDPGIRAWWAAKSEAERAAIQARIARAKPSAPPS